ncbi:MAG TPA: hypothetical protein PKI20_21365 [Verrucomicrobiota bacterium]|nr:hypothetical protein [Verrucomicrobiota bacterium]
MKAKPLGIKPWPFPVSDEEIRAHGYLKSLAPAEELALFLSLRSHCLKEARGMPEATACYAQAVRMGPGSRPYRLLPADAQHPDRSAGAPPGNAGRVSRAGLPPAYAQAAPLLPPPPSTTVTPQPGVPLDPNPLLKIRQQ